MPEMLPGNSLSAESLKHVHPYTFVYTGILRPNRLDVHQLPTTISLPNVCKSPGRVVWGVATQFYVGEDLRFTEEGMGIKPAP